MPTTPMLGHAKATLVLWITGIISANFTKLITIGGTMIGGRERVFH